MTTNPLPDYIETDHHPKIHYLVGLAGDESQTAHQSGTDGLEAMAGSYIMEANLHAERTVGREKATRAADYIGGLAAAHRMSREAGR